MTYFSNELYHYGVLGMKWGVRRYQRADGRLTEEGKQRLREKTVSKSTEKFNKITTKYNKAQEKANKRYVKAEKKATSFFATGAAIENKYQEAVKSQRKANKVAIKGAKWYQTMEKEFAKMGIDVSESVRSVGQEYLDMIKRNSQSMFNAAMYDIQRSR